MGEKQDGVAPRSPSSGFSEPGPSEQGYSEVSVADAWVCRSLRTGYDFVSLTLWFRFNFQVEFPIVPGCHETSLCVF